MRWLITGGGGMLAQDLRAVLGGRGHDVVAVSRAELDVTDAAACATAVRGYDVVVNAAAWTDVDGAEEHEGAAFAVNAVGAANLARAAEAASGRLVHVSTDYVFDGSRADAYPASWPLAPMSAYGRTKAAGEWAVRAAGREHLVVRTAWLYGRYGRCFPRTIARLLRERSSVDVVADQTGQPTWTVDLADLVVRLVEARVPGGVYHGTASGRGTWFELAREVARELGMSIDAVRPTTGSVLARRAPRPASSVLAHDSLVDAGVPPIGDWRQRFRAAAPEVLG